MKIFTSGSVDDGKSTLLGRLLYDLQILPDDLIAKITAESQLKGAGDIDYSLAFDGLIDEKAQGITIDVAWRYVTIGGSSLILADCPGHTQYTRNMVSAASKCDAVILLVDAEKGITSQSRRHLAICSLLRIQSIFVAINKIDLVSFNQATYENLVKKISSIALPHPFTSIQFAPTSGVTGCNVVTRSQMTPWYTGLILQEWILNQLHSPALHGENLQSPLIFPIQRAARPSSQWRGYDGTIRAGTLDLGQTVIALPSQQASLVKTIGTFDGELPHASAGKAISVVLTDELDLSRGEVLVSDPAGFTISDLIEANLVWLSESSASLGTRYEIRLGTAATTATISRVHAQVDVETMLESKAETLVGNQIGRVEIHLKKPLALTAYEKSRDLGAFLLVDRLTNETVAAGMIIDPSPRRVFWQSSTISKANRAQKLQQRPLAIWFTGLSGAGKSTIANGVEVALNQKGFSTYMLDGDNVRRGLCEDLGFSVADRAENIRRVGEVAKLMVDAGLIVLASFISPVERERRGIRERFEPGEFVEVYVNTPIGICEERDPKGLYKLARAGKIAEFTGVTAPYEPPANPDISISTAELAPENCVDLVIRLILSRQ